MIKLGKMYHLFVLVRKIFCTCLIASATVFPFTIVLAHPLEFHMEPLDASAVERVLTSLELLMGELKNAGGAEAADLPDGALGITAILWSIEDAVAAMDETWASKSPTLLRSLRAAGYQESPYVVAVWKIEAERVLEAYEVLSGNFQGEEIRSGLAQLEKDADQLTEEERVRRERVLIRKVSMLQTTAGDISQVAPFRQRLDRLTDQLGN
jgi:hypothetical protein